MGVQSPGKEPLFTPEQVIEALRRARGNVALTARSLVSPERPNGISRETVYQYIRRHPEIAEAIRTIHEERGDRLEIEIELRALDAETKGSTPALLRLLERKYPERGWGRVDLGGAETDITLCVQHLRRVGVDPRNAFASLAAWLAAWAMQPIEDRALLPWETYTPDPRTQRLLPQMDAVLEPLDETGARMVVDAMLVLTPDALNALRNINIEPAAMLQWAVNNTDRLQRGPPQLEEAEQGDEQ